MIGSIVSDDEVGQLERQMQDIQARIDLIKGDRAAAKAAARRASLAAKPPKPIAAKKVASSERPKNQQRKKSTNGGGAGGSGSYKKKHKGNRDDSEDVEETVTFEMKRELAVKITNFEGDKLERAIDIIRMGRPDLLSVSYHIVQVDSSHELS